MDIATTPAADARQLRGRVLAKTARIKRKNGGLFIVPSASDAGSYIVETAPGSEGCSCPDFELHGARCKHMWAVEYARSSETLPDGSMKTTETLKVTYTQEWASYNLAQTTEKSHVARLLMQLCAGVACIWIQLHLPEDRPEPGAFKAELQAADTGEQ